MSEAPEFCIKCPLGVYAYCMLQTLSDNMDRIVPSDSCPLVRLDKAKADRVEGEKDYCDLMTRHDALFVQLEAANAEIERLREALTWYAENNSWIDYHGPDRHHPKIRDCGSIARAALAEGGK